MGVGVGGPSPYYPHAPPHAIQGQPPQFYTPAHSREAQFHRSSRSRSRSRSPHRPSNTSAVGWVHMDKEARRFAAHGVASGGNVTSVSVQDVLQSASVAQEPVMGPVRPQVEPALPDADDYDPFADHDADDDAPSNVVSGSVAVASNTFSAAMGTIWGRVTPTILRFSRTSIYGVECALSVNCYDPRSICGDDSRRISSFGPIGMFQLSYCPIPTPSPSPFIHPLLSNSLIAHASQTKTSYTYSCCFSVLQELVFENFVHCIACSFVFDSCFVQSSHQAVQRACGYVGFVVV
jgi:hypothetical protein